MIDFSENSGSPLPIRRTESAVQQNGVRRTRWTLLPGRKQPESQHLGGGRQRHLNEGEPLVAGNFRMSKTGERRIDAASAGLKPRTGNLHCDRTCTHGGVRRGGMHRSPESRGRCGAWNRHNSAQQADAYGAESPAGFGGQRTQNAVVLFHRPDSFALLAATPNPPNRVEARRWALEAVPKPAFNPAAVIRGIRNAKQR